MRIAIDGRTIQDHFPGIARYVYNLVSALVDLDVEIELLLLHDPERPSTRFNLETLRDVRLIPLPLVPFSWRSQLVIPRLLRRLEADLYHSTYYVMPYMAGCPTVVTLYDTIPFLFPEYLPSGWARWFYPRAMRLAAGRSGLILAISEAAADDLSHFLSLESSSVLVTPLAADTRFRPVEDRMALERWKQAAGLPPRYVLYLGINKPHKNLARLVRAWRLVSDAWETAWGDLPALVLAGKEDPRYPDARQAVDEAKLEQSVIFLGDVPDQDLPELYNGAILFVFPSLYEGFGLPVLEAMACGVPVACSNRSSLPEIVGPAAMTFNPEDEHEMAEAIVTLLRDPMELDRRRRLGLAQSRQFSWRRTAQFTLDAYRRLL